MTPLQANRERVGDNMVLSRKCRVTHELVTLTVTIVEYYKWKGGECSQNVWPDLTPDEREFIQTGYTQAEWESIFSDSDEEDEEDEVDQSGHPSIATSDPDAPGVITAEELAREYREEAIAEGHIPPEELRGSDLDALAGAQKAHDTYLAWRELRRPQDELDYEQDLLNGDAPFA